VLTPASIIRAGVLRTELYRRMVALLDEVAVIALPTVQLPPFPVEWPWPEAVAGSAMERYVTWMRSCSRISATTLPALSVPAGFTPEGLPVGLQLVGRPRGEAELLAIAAALEVRLGAGARRPPL
jgi:amidase